MSSSTTRNAAWCEYLLRTGQGDQEAFAALYDESSPIIYGLAVRILGNAADAEDVVLDTYMQVWRTARSYCESRTNVVGWLAVIVRSRAIDKLRQRRFANVEGASIIENRPATEIDSNPEAKLEKSRSAEAVLRAFELLPANIRRVLELAYFGDLSHSEIAVKVNEPLGTVKSRIRRGLELLRKTLDGGRWRDPVHEDAASKRRNCGSSEQQPVTGELCQALNPRPYRMKAIVSYQSTQIAPELRSANPRVAKR